MYTFISPTGERIRTKTVREFAEQVNMPYASAVQVSGGFRSIRGWTSTHPRAKRSRERIHTELYNIHTGETQKLGRWITRFAKQHKLNVTELNSLITGRQIYYRGWVLRKMYNVIFDYCAGKNF